MVASHPGEAQAAAAAQAGQAAQGQGAQAAQGQSAQAGVQGAQAAAPVQKVQTVRRTEPKVGRNDPCPCGSGKKYKKCHGAASRETRSDGSLGRLRADPLFESISDDDLTALPTPSRRDEPARRHLSRGSDGATMYVIQEGAVEIAGRRQDQGRGRASLRRAVFRRALASVRPAALGLRRSRPSRARSWRSTAIDFAEHDLAAFGLRQHIRQPVTPRDCVVHPRLARVDRLEERRRGRPPDDGAARRGSRRVARRLVAVHLPVRRLHDRLDDGEPRRGDRVGSSAVHPLEPHPLDAGASPCSGLPGTTLCPNLQALRRSAPAAEQGLPAAHELHVLAAIQNLIEDEAELLPRPHGPRAERAVVMRKFTSTIWLRRSSDTRPPVSVRGRIGEAHARRLRPEPLDRGDQIAPDPDRVGQAKQAQ